MLSWRALRTIAAMPAAPTSPAPDAGGLAAAKERYEAGVAAAGRQQWSAALLAFDDALRLAPGRPSVLAARGAVQLRRGEPDAALRDLDRALAVDPALFEAWCHRGLALAELGVLDSALASFDQALALDVRHPGAQLERAVLLARLQRPGDALAALDALIEQEPGDAESRLHRARLLASQGHSADALRDCATATALAPANAQAWSVQGQVLRDLGRGPAALVAFERAIALGADAQLTGYFAAALAHGVGKAHPLPPRAPDAYVRGLFDSYGPGFEQHLLATLHYRAHRVLAALIADAAGPSWRFASVLDLGCGSGLLGKLLKSRSDWLAGVDLSPAMLASASRSGVYDRLDEAELHQHLDAAPAARHDLVVATDVFIYIGALEPVFRAVARVLAPAGRFAFSCEALAESDARAARPGWALLPSLRYAQSERYLLSLAAAHGLHLERRLDAPLREEQGRQVAGLYTVLRRA
jgi:predicted TPR repeat methyltransferase